MEVPSIVVFAVTSIIALIIAGLVTGIVVIVNSKIVVDAENVDDYNAFVDSLNINENDKDHLKTQYSGVFNGLTNCNTQLTACTTAEPPECPACQTCPVIPDDCPAQEICPTPVECDSCCPSNTNNTNTSTSSRKFNNVGMILGIVFGAVVLFVGGLYVTTRRNKPLLEFGSVVESEGSAGGDYTTVSLRRPSMVEQPSRVSPPPPSSSPPSSPPPSRPPLTRRSDVKYVDGKWVTAPPNIGFRSSLFNHTEGRPYMPNPAVYPSMPSTLI